MFEKDQILDKLEKILPLIEAEHKELVFLARDYQLTRFANNYIHQNIAEKDLQLTIKIGLGKKIAVGTVNSLEAENLKMTIRKLQEILQFQPDDPYFEGLPFPEAITDFNTYDEETAACTPERRASMVKVVTSEAEKFNVQASGQCVSSVEELAVINSNGVRAYNISTEANLMSLVVDELDGYSSLASRKIRNINAQKVAEESVSKCVNSRKPVEILPDVYPVVMEPYAVGDLVSHLCLENFNGLSYLESKSAFSGRLGEKITGNLINIHNDPLDQEGLYIPIDYEGLPRKKVTLVENGIARAVTHNAYTAKRAGAATTGNKEAATLNAPYPLHLSMDEGSSTVEDMIASIEKGIYITKLNYLSTVEPKQTINTGLTRGGTFLIKNGKISKPIYNLRFTESILQAFSEVSMIADRRRLHKEYYCATLVPALKINKFRFTGSTRVNDK